MGISFLIDINIFHGYGFGMAKPTSFVIVAIFTHGHTHADGSAQAPSHHRPPSPRRVMAPCPRLRPIARARPAAPVGSCHCHIPRPRGEGGRGGSLFCLLLSPTASGDPNRPGSASRLPTALVASVRAKVHA